MPRPPRPLATLGPLLAAGLLNLGVREAACSGPGAARGRSAGPNRPPITP